MRWSVSNDVDLPCVDRLPGRRPSWEEAWRCGESRWKDALNLRDREICCWRLQQWRSSWEVCDLDVSQGKVAVGGVVSVRVREALPLSFEGDLHVTQGAFDPATPLMKARLPGRSLEFRASGRWWFASNGTVQGKGGETGR